MRAFSFIVIGIAALCASGTAMAEPPLDVTIQVVESPADLPDAVTKTIVLPPAAAAAARESAQFGLDRANAARATGQGGPEFGQSAAEEARTRRHDPGRRP